MVTDKPNNLNKKHLDFDLRRSQVPQSILQTIDNHFKVPNQKYENPMTSSQELGWIIEDKLNRNQRRFPRLGCDVTKYADEYSALKGRSPYATRDILAKDKEPSKK